MTPHLRDEYDRRVWRSVYEQNEYGLPDDLSGWCVLDVGGHVGSFARLAALRGARVVCFEPDPGSARLARANLADLAGRALVVEAAVVAAYEPGPDGPRFVQALSRCEDSAGRTLYCGGDGVPVHLITFDVAVRIALAHAAAPRVSLCKLDCEGCEYAIVEGCDLSAIDRLAVEFHANYVPSAPARAYACRERLEVQGFAETCFETTHPDLGWYRLYRGERR